MGTCGELSRNDCSLFMCLPSGLRLVSWSLLIGPRFPLKVCIRVKPRARCRPLWNGGLQLIFDNNLLCIFPVGLLQLGIRLVRLQANNTFLSYRNSQSAVFPIDPAKCQSTIATGTGASLKI